MWGIWLVIAGFCFIIEMLTVGFLTFWFAIGAILAMCISFVVDSIFIQTFVFVVSSIGLLFLTKPFVTKITKKDGVVTNANKVIGKLGTVVKEVNSLEGNGQIKVGSEIWSAITTDTQNIPKGTKVKILEIDGVKAVVTSEIYSTVKI